MSTRPAFGQPREISPRDALREELFRSASWAGFVTQRVNDDRSTRGFRKEAARQERMLRDAERACRHAGFSASEIEAVKAAGAATDPQRDWLS